MVDLKFVLMLAGVLGVSGLGAWITNKYRKPKKQPGNGPMRAPCFPFRDRPIKVVTMAGDKSPARETSVSWQWDDCDQQLEGEIIKLDDKKRSEPLRGLGADSAFVKPGAERISSQGDFSDLFHVAFKNPDGTYVVVITNARNAPRTVTLDVSEQYAEVHLEPGSLTTLIW